MTRTSAASLPSSDPEHLGIRSKLLGFLYRQRIEQERLRRRIHDDIGQYLTSISINAGLLARKGYTGPEKELVTAITSASKMACRSTHELTNQLGPGRSCGQNGIESDLIELVGYYDIDQTGPAVSLVGFKFLDRAPKQLVQAVHRLFEQFLLVFFHYHRASEFALSLSQPEAGQAHIRANFVAGGLQLCEALPQLTALEQAIQQSSGVVDLQLCTGAVETLQQLVLKVQLPTDRRSQRGESTSC